MKKEIKKRGPAAPRRRSAPGKTGASDDAAFERELDKAFNSLEDDYLASAALSIEDISGKVLLAAKRLTGSSFGFAGYIDPATGWFIAVTHTREIWDKCRIAGKTIVFREFKGLWGWVLKNKKPILTNKASSDSRSCGTPKGHIKIDKFLAVPAVFNRKLAGMVALANPSGDYTKRDLAAAEKFARIYAIILQRKFSEDALRESEEKHRAIINASRDIIYTVNAEGVITYMSRQAENYGYSPADLVGRHVLEFAHPGDKAMLAQALSGALETGRTMPLLSYRVRKKDGSYFYAEQKSGLIMKGGRPRMISCIIRDVTDRRAMEDALKNSEAKYRALFDRAGDGIFIMATDGSSSVFNDAFAKMHGYANAGEMACLNLKELDTPQTAKLGPERLRRMLAGESLTFEVEHYHRDGHVFPLSVSCRVVKFEGRIYFLGFHRDISAQKKVESALSRLTSCFLKFGPEPEENIDHITRTAGEILGSSCVLYNRLEGDLLCTISGWQAPPGLDLRGKAKGHICMDVISGAKHKPLVVRDLQNSPYAESDPNIKKFGLKTYIGCPVTVEGRTVGSLCAAFQADKAPSPEELKVMSLLAKALGIEEQRSRAGTALKATEETLHESDRKIRALFDQTFQFIGMLDPDGTVLEANRTAMQFAGIKESDCIGRPFWDTAWWAHSAEMRDKLRKAVKKAAQGEAVRFEATHPAADGSIHHVDFSLKPVRDAAGAIIYLIPEGRDITEQKKMETALKQNEETLRNIFDTAPDMIFFKGLDGRYIKVNKACAAVFQMTPEEFEGRSDGDIFPPKDAERLIASDREVVRTGRTLTIDDNRVISGKEYYFSTVKSPLKDLAGKTIGILGIVRDVTEQKRTEEELINTRAAAKAGKITGDAAHDFNNILTTINGYAAIMLESVSDKSPLKVEILEIVKAVRKATSVTEKLQLYGAKPEDKK